MTKEIRMPDTNAFWPNGPNGTRLAVSVALVFEGGGQPISGAGGFTSRNTGCNSTGPGIDGAAGLHRNPGEEP